MIRVRRLDDMRGFVSFSFATIVKSSSDFDTPSEIDALDFHDSESVSIASRKVRSSTT